MILFLLSKKKRHRRSFEREKKVFNNLNKPWTLLFTQQNNCCEVLYSLKSIVARGKSWMRRFHERIVKKQQGQQTTHKKKSKNKNCASYTPCLVYISRKNRHHLDVFKHCTMIFFPHLIREVLCVVTIVVVTFFSLHFTVAPFFGTTFSMSDWTFAFFCLPSSFSALSRCFNAFFLYIYTILFKHKFYEYTVFRHYWWNCSLSLRLRFVCVFSLFICSARRR